jgi:hypothetical protein
MDAHRPPHSAPPKPAADAGSPNDGISRRDFARLTLGAAAAAALPASLLVEPPAAAAQSLPPEAPLSSAAEAEAKLKAEAILDKYGSRLDDLQKDELRKLVHGIQAQVEKLRAHPLENGEGPALVFQPYRRKGA